MTPDPKHTVLLRKLYKARRLAESARWALLDVKILLDDIETDLASRTNEAMPSSSGEGEDSRPGDGSER